MFSALILIKSEKRKCVCAYCVCMILRFYLRDLYICFQRIEMKHRQKLSAQVFEHAWKPRCTFKIANCRSAHTIHIYYVRLSAVLPPLALFLCACELCREKRVRRKENKERFSPKCDVYLCVCVRWVYPLKTKITRTQKEFIVMTRLRNIGWKSRNHEDSSMNDGECRHLCVLFIHTKRLWHT